MIYAIMILFLLAMLALVVACTALQRADRALGITTWTDPDTMISLEVLHSRLKLIDEKQKLEAAEKDILKYVESGGHGFSGGHELK